MVRESQNRASAATRRACASLRDSTGRCASYRSSRVASRHSSTHCPCHGYGRMLSALAACYLARPVRIIVVMSPATKRLVNVSVLPAAVVTIACIATGWCTRAEAPFYQSVPVGNKELVRFRQGWCGWDFRIAVAPPGPVFGLRSRAPTEPERAAEERAWGRPDHWLRLPEFELSLWWPFSVSLVVLGLWIAGKWSRPSRGFPVTAVRGAT